ncbi:MAG: OsmC family protein [Planctomycetota bacterium]
MSLVSVKHEGGCVFSVEARGYRMVADTPPGWPECSNKGPTPPEMLVASLATCVGIYLARYMREAKLPYEGFTIDAAYSKAENPDRIGSIAIDVNLPEELPEARKKALIRVAEHCTVHNTLRQPPEVSIEIK